LVTESFLDEESHCGLKSVRSEYLNQKATLEGRKVVHHLRGEFLLRSLGLPKLSPYVVAVKGESRNELAESVAVHAKHLSSVNGCPLRQPHVGVRACADTSREELPFVLLEHFKVHSLDEMHTVCKSISLE
jgi:hypothetical protein